MIRASRVAAVAVVLALAGGVALASRQSDDQSAPSTAVSTIASTGSTTTSTTSLTVEPVATTLASTGEPTAVIAGGLAAWGEFAVTGDLGGLEPWFDPAGPQFDRFREEAPDLGADPLGDPPYTVTFEESDREVSDDEIRVHARVVFVRTGEPSQSFNWVIVLRQAETWQIWTVEEAG